MNTKNKMKDETVREYLARIDRNKRLSIGCSWTTRKINSSQLKSKQDYQRKINKNFIAEAVAHFDPNDVDPVHVSYRDGRYYVIDGQHTILILEEINDGKPIDIDCIVHKGMTYIDEAKYYVRQYEKKHRHSYNEMSVASYEAGDKFLSELAQRVRDVGGRFPYDKTTKKGVKICAIKKITSLYKKDADNTILAIKCLIEAYQGREKSIPAEIIAGTMEFLQLYGDTVLVARLVEALSKYNPQLLINTAKNLKMRYPINWTETLRDKYNEMSKKGKIKPKYSI